jgi:hypothetical protein
MSLILLCSSHIFIKSIHLFFANNLSLGESHIETEFLKKYLSHEYSLKISKCSSDFGITSLQSIFSK